MLLARMIAPIHSLGPGQRVGIWIQGCSKNCKGCMAEELQEFDKSKNIPVDMLIPIIEGEASRNECNGLTVSGGDPFEQPKDLFLLLKALRTTFSDILVYTGYTFAEINNSELMKRCLRFIDVLVDGRYIELGNTGKSRIYGSDNQKVYFLNKSLVESYKLYDAQERKLESFIHNNKVITVGIQERDGVMHNRE